MPKELDVRESALLRNQINVCLTDLVEELRGKLREYLGSVSGFLASLGHTKGIGWATEFLEKIDAVPPYYIEGEDPNIDSIHRKAAIIDEFLRIPFEEGSVRADFFKGLQDNLKFKGRFGFVSPFVILDEAAYMGTPAPRITLPSDRKANRLTFRSKDMVTIDMVQVPRRFSLWMDRNVIFQSRSESLKYTDPRLEGAIPQSVLILLLNTLLATDKIAALLILKALGVDSLRDLCVFLVAEHSSSTGTTGGAHASSTDVASVVPAPSASTETFVEVVKKREQNTLRPVLGASTTVFADNTTATPTPTAPDVSNHALESARTKKNELGSDGPSV